MILWMSFSEPMSRRWIETKVPQSVPDLKEKISMGLSFVVVRIQLLARICMDVIDDVSD